MVVFSRHRTFAKPLETLAELSSKVKSGGLILIEVPHANDFLLSTVASEEFKQFTLWSQHLILHTRRSLKKILEFVGLVDIQIKEFKDTRFQTISIGLQMESQVGIKLRYFWTGSFI